MRRWSVLGWGAAAFLAPAFAALGHPGPRVWVNVEGGRVTTWQGPYPAGDPANYAPGRVFGERLVEDSEVWATDFPGFQRVPGGNVPAGTNFSYDIAGPLLFYEPGAADHDARFRTVARHFGGVGERPQMAVTNELFQTKVTGDGFVGGDLAFAYNGSAGDHNHLSYTLLGDGTAAGGGADGIYVLQLRLTAGGFDASEPYFLVLGKNAADAELADAVSLAGRTLVLPGDANTDGVVSFADFQRLERGFGDADADWGDGDFNADGLANHLDFLLLRDHFGRRRDGTIAAVGSLPEMAQVPEPGFMWLFALAAFSFFLRAPRRLA
jgi:hypothetical protein